ncbi:hypothetical protein M0G43_03955 [Subsaxibacter sp. CAU 1640]|uniref:hypothetical protein n=1 Tax=Subsaxibacter sp. CAU 1640 TaxID=2933271 RepID=UPI0020032B5E|nr:hypothetical protein [Subsaxibacter sp. CAU 1640]MCK7589718.1 hypothetical protein [Subsaxibacter sp. CAU 1640]
MKIKSLLVFSIIVAFYSCGSKKSAVSKEELIKATNDYVQKVDKMTLKTEVTEGALTDAEGFKDIGTFKYTVYFDENTNELFKINNVEKTSETIDETYYFKDGKFVFVKFNRAIDGSTKLYNGSLKDGKTEGLKFYQNKAERFQKEFKKSH